MTRRDKPLLLLTIDVEEDMPGWEITDPVTVSNVVALPHLHDECSAIGVKPTYLCTYPIVTREASSATLLELLARGDCEIGTHLHPWNTPPFGKAPGSAADERKVPYFQCDLDRKRFRAKLENLHDAVTRLTGEPPSAFRAGRFGINAETLAELPRLGYEVDSSVTPLTSHRGEGGGPDFRTAPRFPYRPSKKNVGKRGDMDIIEIPVSVGVTRRLPKFLLNAFVHMPRGLRLRGLLSRDYLGLVDFGWLYPARFDLELMQGLARTLVREENPVLNVFLHSSELVDGCSGRLKTPLESEGDACAKRTVDILRFCVQELGARPVTLTEAGRVFAREFGLDPRTPSARGSA